MTTATQVPMASIMPVHMAVKGRLRLRIEGLRGSDVLARTLEHGLKGLDGVRQVSASPLTGTVLILYRPDVACEPILQAVEQVVEAGAEPPPRSVGAAAVLPPARVLEGEPWHQMSVRQIVARLGSSTIKGLSDIVAVDRLTRYGPNVLVRPEQRSRAEILVEQFQSLPVALLGTAAVLSLATGGVVDAVVILAVVALNAAIGYVTESQAERTIAELGSLGQRSTMVLRSGDVRAIPADEIVTGDLIVLQPGTIVPADARLVEANGLRVSEAALTGESLPVEKTAVPIPEADVPLTDRANIVYRGTSVAEGSGLALVVATGMRTVMGGIQTMIGTTRSPETPLQRQLGQLGRQLVGISGAFCALVFLLGSMRGYGLLSMLRSSISLAVAAVPEGLPTLATTTLALGVREMRGHNVLVRHLDAVETLGAVEVMCFDKTGTLTLNRMSVVAASCGNGIAQVLKGDIIDATGAISAAAAQEGFRRLFEIAALCNDSEATGEGSGAAANGSATELALLQFAIDAGLDIDRVRREHRRLSTQYRTEHNRYMATVHRAGRRRLVAVKGDPNEVLGLCLRYLDNGKVRPLADADRSRIEQRNANMASDGLRVLGFAYADAAGLPEALTEGLVWIGLAGLADPTRRGMKDLMTTFHRAGIRTVMITGDQRVTARAVARQLQLSTQGDVEVVDARLLERADGKELRDLVNKADAFARVSPAHKLRIVQALQAAGRVVAMTGDGVNDGPALKAADIGVAMGHGGTDVARDVSDIVLQDDDLRSMAMAVARGRTTYENIRRAIRYLLATNFGEILVVTSGTALGWGQPLTPMQLLWINLLTDVLPAVGLALEPPAPDVLRRPPRHLEESILRGADFRRVAREGAVIGAATLCVGGYGMLRHGPGARTSTMMTGSLIGAQLLHALSARSSHHGIFNPARLPENPALKKALGITLGLQVAGAVVPGLRQILGVVPLGTADAILALAGATVPFMINEAAKPRTSPDARGETPAKESHLIVRSSASSTKRSQKAGMPAAMSS